MLHYDADTEFGYLLKGKVGNFGGADGGYVLLRLNVDGRDAASCTRSRRVVVADLRHWTHGDDGTSGEVLQALHERLTRLEGALAEERESWASSTISWSTRVVSPTALEMNQFLEENRRLRTSAEIAMRPASGSLLPSSIVGVCHWLFSDLEPDDAAWFLARLGDGDGLAADDPIAALRSRIVKMRVGGGRVNETDAPALIILAWNAHRSGETRSKLQLPRGGLTPENFPEPR
jgi:hypothetical protein